MMMMHGGRRGGVSPPVVCYFNFLQDTGVFILGIVRTATDVDFDGLF